MKERPKQPEPSQFLSGWKEIANHLGKGVRTAQRYERDMGLPVRRPAGRLSGSVVAVPAELDGWVKASPIRDAFHLRGDTSKGSAEAEALRRGISQLRQLREQMLTLRSEMNKSIERLHNSVYLLHGEVQRRTTDPLSHLESFDDHTLLNPGDRSTTDGSATYPKAS